MCQLSSTFKDSVILVVKFLLKQRIRSLTNKDEKACSILLSPQYDWLETFCFVLNA